MEETYWAGNEDVDQLVNDLQQRVTAYRGYIADTGVASKARRCWSSYYGRGTNQSGDSSRLLVAGDNQHLIKQTANIVAQLVDLSLNALLRNKPAYVAVARNGDYDAKAQAPLATGLLDEYDRRLSLSEMERRAVKTAWLTTMAWVSVHWNETLGEGIGATPEGQIQNAGDVETFMHTVFDVAYDTGITDVNAIPWCIMRTRVNKWELAARYPSHRQDILNASADARSDNTDGDWLFASYKQTQDTDYIWLYEFRHVPNAALPRGRLVFFVENTCLEDVIGEDQLPQYPYDDLGCYPITPDQMIGASIGHTPIADLLGLQEGHDAAFSAIASVINAGGIINWWAKPGSGLKVSQMDGNLNVVYATEKPEVIGGAVLQPGVKDYMAMQEQLMRQRLAVNDVVAGDVSKGIPAQAIAALQAQFFEFHGGLQSSYVTLVQNVRTGILKMLKKFAKSERIALLAGHANGYQYTAFSKDSIASVEKIMVQPVGAATRTPAGRLDLGEKLLNRGLIDGPKFLDLLNTGQVDFTDDENQAYTLKLDKDKELLMKGIGLAPMDPMQPFDEGGNPNYIPGAEGLRPLATDDFVRDIKAYRSVLFAPDIRSNDAVTNAVLSVIEECKRLHRQTDPYFISILGIQPPPPPMPPEMMGPGGAQGDANSAPQSNASSMQEAPRDARNGGMVPGENPGGVSQPRPPTNPITGERPQPPFAQQ